MKRLLCVALAAALVLCGCAADAWRAVEMREETVWAMDTVMDLKLWGKGAEEGIGQITAMLYALDEKWSVTRQESVLSRMNRGEDPALTPQDEDLLVRVEALSQRTGGAFNPWMHSVSAAWGFYGGNYRVPTQAQIDEALAQRQLDLGAALKGYAGQQAVELLEKLDMERGILTLGGNVQTYGEKPDGSPWNVGIQNPNGGVLGTLAVTGTASIVTSGSYQRYFEENGVRYHHILDPKTGYPADTGLTSVTVICRDGLTADALSTALFVMGLERGSDFWRESDDFEAVFLLTDGRIYATAGACLSGCEYEVISR